MSNLITAENWAVTMFSFTNELLLAAQSPLEVLDQAASQTQSTNFELDGPQFFRNYPNPIVDEIAALKSWLAKTGNSIVTVGGYADRALGSNRLRSSGEIVDLVAKQLELASTLGVRNLRLQADALTFEETALLHKKAEKCSVTIVFELQGSMAPDAPLSLECLRIVRELKSPNVKLMFDTSLFMRRFPPTFASYLNSIGIDDVQVSNLEKLWLENDLANFRGALLGAIKSGDLPPQIQAALPTLLSRFGHSRPIDWIEYAPHVAYVHLKFWDESNEDQAVSDPVLEAARLLAEFDFEGYYCAEWGGHDWLSLEHGSSASMVNALKQHLAAT